tara:strand:+ start:633 stop:803 length:171 start_codon:yes stop_codon:yes gene_type:complete
MDEKRSVYQGNTKEAHMEIQPTYSKYHLFQDDENFEIPVFFLAAQKLAKEIESNQS